MQLTHSVRQRQVYFRKPRSHICYIRFFKCKQGITYQISNVLPHLNSILYFFIKLDGEFKKAVTN